MSVICFSRVSSNTSIREAREKEGVKEDGGGREEEEVEVEEEIVVEEMEVEEVGKEIRRRRRWRRRRRRRWSMGLRQSNSPVISLLCCSSMLRASWYM